MMVLNKTGGGNIVFVNPPYGRKEQPTWIKKCYHESLKPNTLVVLLIPARTDTIVFHTYLYGKAEIRFIKGRLKFINPNSKVSKDRWTSAPFPSMVCILGGKNV